MKLFVTTLAILAALLYSEHATAQYCGLTYSYDNAGNRIKREVTDCEDPGPGGGGGNSGKRDEAEDTPKPSEKNAEDVLTQSISPNPTAGAVNITFSKPVTGAEITIADNTGRTLLSTTRSGSAIPLNLFGYSAGVYFITVKTEGNSFQNTVIKQ